MTRPETPEALLQLASQLGRAGRLAEAIDAYQRLLRLRPELPDSWYNLANLQARAGRHSDSLASYQRALDHQVSRPEEVHLNRAVLFATRLARPDAAAQELGIALQLNPRYLPAWLNLGNLNEQRGDLCAALQAYEQVLHIEPGHALALARLVPLKQADGPDAPLLDQARKAMADPRTSEADRADLGFGLGKALDELGAYDEAFAVYQQANRASRLSLPYGAAHYDRAAHAHWVDQILRSFARPATSTGPRPDATRPLVFICGMFRSGSTLVEQMLAAHPKVTAGGEIELLPDMVKDRLGSFRGGASVSDAATLESLRQAYLAGLGSRHPGAGLITDKRPDNFLYIGLIKALFPHAKIVHTLRDPLDNCLSVYFLHLTRTMPYAMDLADIAHWYGQYRRLMQHWQSLYPGEIHDVKYDELVNSPRPVAESLLQYLDLPWDDACLNFHHARNVVSTASVWQVRQPLYTRSSGRWRHYQAHLGALREALASLGC